MKDENPLTGKVAINGIKNVAPGVLVASAMVDEDMLIGNLPDVRDINMMLEAIREIEVEVTRLGTYTACIDGGSISTPSVESENVEWIHASYYLIGALLGKYRWANVPMLGDYGIGQRPIDQHLKDFTALGGEAELVNGRACVMVKRLCGERIFFDVVLVGATIGVMVAAALSGERTIPGGVVKEPYIVSIVNSLNSVDANIKDADIDVTRVIGVPQFHDTTHSIIPDQIEVGTFTFAAVIMWGDIYIKGLASKHTETISARLYEAGCGLVESGDEVRTIGTPRLRAVNVEMSPYSDLLTDM